VKYTLTVEDCGADEVRIFLDAFDAHTTLRDVDNMCRNRIKYVDGVGDAETDFLEPIRSVVCDALGDS
jgi:hypothetical protein